MIWKMGEKTCLFNSAYRPQIQQSRAKQVVESIKSFSSHNYLLTYSLIENLFKWHFSYLFQVSVHDTSYATNNQVESALCNSSIHTTTVVSRVGIKLKEVVWNIAYYCVRDAAYF